MINQKIGHFNHAYEDMYPIRFLNKNETKLG